MVLKYFGKFVAFKHSSFLYIAHINYWLCSQEKQIFENFYLIFLDWICPCCLTIFHKFCKLIKKFYFANIFSTATFCSLAVFVHSFLKRFEVLENKLIVYDLFVSDRVNISFYVNNIVVFKTSYHMYDGIYLSDICKKLVAQSFSFACSFDQACNVYNLYCSRLYFLRIYELRKFVESWVWHSDHAHIGVFSCKWIICRQSFSIGERIE